MTIAKNIKLLREHYDVTQRELADIAGVTENAVSKWENGYAEPRMGAIERIAACYGLKKSNIIEEDGLRAIAADMGDDFQEDDFVDVPLYGSIAAGSPIEMDSYDSTYPVPTKVRARYPDGFLLKVDGESMSRVLPNGSYAYISPSEVVDKPMKPYAVRVNGHAATIKRVRALNNGFELVPDSTDPTYKPVVYDYGVEGTDHVTVIGRVVWYCVPFDWDF